MVRIHSKQFCNLRASSRYSFERQKMKTVDLFTLAQPLVGTFPKRYRSILLLSYSLIRPDQARP